MLNTLIKLSQLSDCHKTHYLINYHLQTCYFLALTLIHSVFNWNDPVLMNFCYDHDLHFTFHSFRKLYFYQTQQHITLTKHYFASTVLFLIYFEIWLRFKMRNEHQYFTKTQSEHNIVNCIWSPWDMVKQRYKICSYHICTFEMWPFN